jgi:hypothetical protein
MAHPYRGPEPTPDDKPAPEPHNDQDIDTAGTEADDDRPGTRQQKAGGRPEEVPGDENAHDIVGPTGEEMPNQTHAGVQSPSRRKTH